MNHTINDLREHLFATLDDLRDKSAPMDTERAKAVADVAQTIINSAKVEVEHLRVTGNSSASGFIPLDDHNAKGTTTTVSMLGNGITRTVHKAR